MEGTGVKEEKARSPNCEADDPDGNLPRVGGPVQPSSSDTDDPTSAATAEEVPYSTLAGTGLTATVSGKADGVYDRLVNGQLEQDGSDGHNTPTSQGGAASKEGLYAVVKKRGGGNAKSPTGELSAEGMHGADTTRADRPMQQHPLTHAPSSSRSSSLGQWPAVVSLGQPKLAVTCSS
jgi:hypothetical protein